MKKSIHLTLPLAALALLLVSAAPASAQSTSTTTTSYGTVSDFTPDSILVQSTASAQPVRYSHSKTTTYVDENGNPVSVETIHSGAPVTVYYTQDGTSYVANKVVVRKVTTTTSAPPVPPPAPPVVVEKKTTTTTTTNSNP